MLIRVSKIMYEASSIRQCVRSLMCSSTPKELCKFYEKEGIIFKEFSLLNEVHYISLNSSISVIRLDQQDCLGGLITYNLSPTHRISNYVYNNKKNLVYGEAYVVKEAYEEISNTTNHDWVSIIRNDDIEKAREFYKKAGDWNQEKHGNGPIHYALVSCGNVFEIYPQRKDKAIIMEYVVMKSSSSLSDLQIEDIQGRQIKFR